MRGSARVLQLALADTLRAKLVSPRSARPSRTLRPRAAEREAAVEREHAEIGGERREPTSTPPRVLRGRKALDPATDEALHEARPSTDKGRGKLTPTAEPATHSPLDLLGSGEAGSWSLAGDGDPDAGTEENVSAVTAGGRGETRR